MTAWLQRRMASLRARPAADPWISCIVVSLVCFGVVMVYSASAVLSHRLYGDGGHYLKRQLLFAGLGLVLMWTCSHMRYRKLAALTYPLLGLSVLLMVLVGFGLGHSAGGATRWLKLGPLVIQPAELAKVGLVMWLADSLARKQEKIRTFSVGFLPHVLMALFLMVLCLKQPDFGSAVMLCALTFAMLFAAGAKTAYTFGAFVAALPMLWTLIATREYRLRRIQSFLHPFEHRYDAGYQVAESLISFGSGSVTGVGLGDSHQKLFFLPEAHTDFIGAIVGEEWGFVGVLLLIVAYTVLALRGVLISLRAEDDYGRYLAVGMALFLGMQALTNLGVVLGLLPTKGLALPFLSYGGSSLLVNCLAAGILLSISRPLPARQPVSAKRRSLGPKHRNALAGAGVNTTWTGRHGV